MNHDHPLGLPSAHHGRPLHVPTLKPVVHMRWTGSDARALEHARTAVLTAANRDKNECLAMVAHELRNALSPMSTAAEVLNTPGLSVSTADQARGIITRQLQTMTRLVNDLLDGARITQGTMDMHVAPTPLTTVLQHAIETVATPVEQRDQHVVAVLPPEAWHVLGDSTRLEQAFVNVLHNASKFTGRGGRIWVSAERRVRPDGTADALVRIRDEGIGVAADMLPHVFGLFKQAGHSPHDARGIGLGLALVRHIVDRHEGRVTLHSGGVGRGSEVVVSLPLLDAG